MTQHCHFFLYLHGTHSWHNQWAPYSVNVLAISISSSRAGCLILIVWFRVIAYLCTFNIMLENAFLSKDG